MLWLKPYKLSLTPFVIDHTAALVRSVSSTLSQFGAGAVIVDNSTCTNFGQCLPLNSWATSSESKPCPALFEVV